MTKNASHTIPHLLILFCILFGLFSPICNAVDYSVGPGDVLKIDVYDHDDLKTTVRVTDQGFIVMPLLGRVQVGGMSLFDVTDKLTKQLADGYIINPQVNIFVEEFGSKKAVILGHVNRPGLIKLRGPTTFLELISQAGGFKEGSGDAATIKRKNGDKKDVILISIRSLVEGGDLSQNVLIHDGDTIYIAKGGMCYVTGEVDEPDAYPCEKQTTVLNLIALAGGFTAKASQSSVRIVRLVDGEKTVTKNVDLGTPVMANDIIVVPESFF
jgi:polysaccharide biosynthesis/export protein